MTQNPTRELSTLNNRSMVTQLSRTCSAALVSALLCASATAATFDRETELRPFAESMAAKHRFEPGLLLTLLADAEYQPKIIQAMDRPAEKLSWYRYRRIFLTSKRIQRGVEFWDKNRAVLERAANRFGVSPEIIVAIIGVETQYGANRGKTRVLDALCTLGFRYLRRAEFFQKELEAFLLLAESDAIDPRSTMGSYAGAMGIPQFISSSYQRYGIDFDGDGMRDLLDNEADAIGSVANYLAQHQWIPGAPMAVPAKIHGVNVRALLKAGYKPHITAAALRKAGIVFAVDIKADTPAAIIALEQKDTDEHWIVFGNFYSVTRYNHSPLYAMAVIQLADSIRSQRTAQ